MPVTFEIQLDGRKTIGRIYLGDKLQNTFLKEKNRKTEMWKNDKKEEN